jgi:hypothetical protein
VLKAMVQVYPDLSWRADALGVAVAKG